MFHTIMIRPDGMEFKEIMGVAYGIEAIIYGRGGCPAPVFVPEGDVDCDGKTNVGDAIYIISYVFRGGPAPCLYRL